MSDGWRERASLGVKGGSHRNVNAKLPAVRSIAWLGDGWIGESAMSMSGVIVEEVYGTQDTLAARNRIWMTESAINCRRVCRVTATTA